MNSKELHDNFEGPLLSAIWKTKKFKPDSVKFQSNIVRKSGNAIQITINEGDCASKNRKTERDELLENKKLGPQENEIYEYAFSLYLPRNFPIVSTRLVLAQWKQNDEKNNAQVDNPILAIRYVAGEFYITLQTTRKKIKIFSTKKEIRGNWIDLIFNIKFTRKKYGFVKIWMNKKQIVDYGGITAYVAKYGYPSTGKFYFKMGLYRDRMKKPMTIYFDEFHKKIL